MEIQTVYDLGKDDTRFFVVHSGNPIVAIDEQSRKKWMPVIPNLRRTGILEYAGVDSKRGELVYYFTEKGLALQAKIIASHEQYWARFFQRLYIAMFVLVIFFMLIGKDWI